MRILIVFISLSFGSLSQIGTGQWRLHFPAKSIGVVATDKTIWTAYEKGVGAYDKASGEMSMWDAVNGLSDISVSCLGECTSDNSIFVGYQNGNLDKIKNNSVTNIPAIKLAQVQGNKAIIKMVEYDEHIYLATGFAIVKIDPKKNEVRDTYYPTNGNVPINDIVFANDSIYALSEDRLYKGDLDNVALADPAQWEEDNRVSALASGVYTDIENVNDALYILMREESLYGSDSLYFVSQNGLVNYDFAPNIISEIEGLNTIEGRLCVNYAGGAKIYNPDFTEYAYLHLYVGGGFSSPLEVAFNDNEYWIADKARGLVKYIADYNSQYIGFSGPPKGDFWGMGYSNGKMAFASGGLTVSQPTFNASGVYTFENEEWDHFSSGEISAWATDSIFDYLTVDIHPTQPEKIAVGTYSKIPISIIDANAGIADTISPGADNQLEWTVFENGWSYVSDVNYDDQGNLWVLNGLSNQPLKVYTNNGEWYSFDLGTAAKNKYSNEMVIDYNGNKWLSIRGSGMFGYKDQGTIETPSDDQFVNLRMGASTGALPSNEVTALAVDFDNEIWIGTDAGFAVLYNSDGAFDAAFGDYNAQRIKLEFEGNVEYVLGATGITAIEVDGANRKWFGTSNAGIILLSADGLEIIEQHTTENSPLISNNIKDLQLNQKTGELFIITDQGLISYRTDATYGVGDYETVQVFPNPVRPEYSGPITIQGIKYDSDIKVTDVAGNLIYQTTSNGGTATWSGKTLNGEQVATGVYLIWTAPNTGKGRKVGKVAIIR
ncbi:MAG: two-component regulator propeller domain-containing protein [Crocinitomicaceae bacterium]|nr:two-component regulator propeller domain-containing protein [Crocinitomicaceae bacterium]